MRRHLEVIQHNQFYEVWKRNNNTERAAAAQLLLLHMSISRSHDPPLMQPAEV